MCIWKMHQWDDRTVNECEIENTTSTNEWNTFGKNWGMTYVKRVRGENKPHIPDEREVEVKVLGRMIEEYGCGRSLRRRASL